MEFLKNYLVEFIGTFFLVFTVASSIMISNDPLLPAIAIGFSLMIMVYAGGHISGGHYNPAVSLAAAIRGALPWKQLVPYWLVQCMGAVAASMVAMCVSTEPIEHVTTFPVISIIVGEFLFTFALCYVVLLTATTKATNGNSYYGLAIGSTVTVGAFAVGSICCGAFNPAVALGLDIIKFAPCSTILVTVATNFIAAVVAAFIFKFVSANEE